MRQEQLHHCRRRGVVRRFQPKFGEALVVAHQLGDRDLKLLDDLFEFSARGRMLQVFDGVELDTAGLEQIKGAARIPSAGVVIKLHSLHNSGAPFEDCREVRRAARMRRPTGALARDRLSQGAES